MRRQCPRFTTTEANTWCKLTPLRPASWHMLGGRIGSSTMILSRWRRQLTMRGGRCSSMMRQIRRSFGRRHCATRWTRLALMCTMHSFFFPIRAICLLETIHLPFVLPARFERTVAVLVAPLFAAPKARVPRNVVRANIFGELGRPYVMSMAPVGGWRVLAERVWWWFLDEGDLSLRWLRPYILDAAIGWRD